MKKTIAIIIATGLGSGYMPKAPGTAGAFLAFLISYYLLSTGVDMNIAHLVLVIVFYFLGVWASNVLEKYWGHDPGKIVIDEMIGIWITYLFIPANWHYYIIGFILFRIFDIWKPLWIGKAEKLKGGWGIMTDDLVAGIFANVVLQIIVLINNHYHLF